jgi:uncharacterized protein (DUF58 family)
LASARSLRATGLTLRGQCFLAAGLACILAAFVMGQRDLLRVGIFVVALPVVCLLAVHRTRYRLSCSRRLEPARVPVGTPAQVTVRVENLSRLPSGVLMAEDKVPYLLGTRPRFVLDRIPSRGSGEVTYTLRSDVRGRFEVGPLTVHLTDPFGLAELSRAFSRVDPVVVTPRVVQIPPIRLGGEWAGGGETRARAVASLGEADVATREYRQGDDLRRVHWRSTARYGELMVRREERPWQSRAVVLLDSRSSAHRGSGAGSSYEWAVSAAASIGLYLSRSGHALRLIDDTGQEVAAVASHSTEAGSEGVLLDALALAKANRNSQLSAAVDAVRRGGGEGLVVAILGSLSSVETDALARLRHEVTAGIAVLLDTEGWAGRSGSPAAATEGFRAGELRLRSAGWRVVPVRYGESLADVWPLAGITGAARNMAAPVTARAAR